MLLGQRIHNELYSIFNDDTQIDKMKKKNKIFFSNDFSIEDSNLIDFKENVDHIIIDDKWFFINYANCKDNVRNDIKECFSKLESSIELPNLTKQHLEEIGLLIYSEKKDDNWKVNFQSIGRSSKIKSKHYLGFETNEIIYEHKENILEFKNIIDIHIDEKKEKIYFKKFSNLKKIHKDFILLYKEATQEEVDNFIIDMNAKSLFKVSDNLKPLERNLKKIKLILDEQKLKILDQEIEVKKYIKKYKISLILNKDKYIVKNNSDLTNLIKIINESYYESELTKEKREDNNTIKIP